MLLEKRANIGAVDTDRFRPLHAASGSGHIDVVELLLKKDSQFDSQGRGGQNMLQITASMGKQSQRQLLIEKAKIFDIQANKFRDALHVACIHGYVVIVEQLICLDVSLSKADEHGWDSFIMRCMVWTKAGFLTTAYQMEGDRDLLSPAKTLSPSSWNTIEKSTHLWLDEGLASVRYSSKQ